MDLIDSEEYERFRDEVKRFLADGWPPRGEEEASLDEAQQAARFRKRAIEQGYVARSVPKAYGGSEQPPDSMKAAIIREEFTRAGAPQDVGAPEAQLIPTLVAHGSAEQKKRYLPRTVTGELAWCQGYSEPGAGSDLASVQTRAELVRGEWVINGQKIWTSYADRAEMVYLLCRTEPPEIGKHAGLSYLLAEMNQPGIEVVPLKGLCGDSHFSQVFFTDARTPADQIVGKRGQGWIVSRSTLAAERNVVGTAGNTIEHFEKVLELAKSTRRGGRPAIKDSSVRQRLVELEAYVMCHEYSSYRQLTSHARGEKPGLIGTMNKHVGTEISRRLSTLAVEIAGDGGLEAPTPETRVVGTGNPGASYLSTLGSRTGGGTSNIQRNIIGEHGLGLPRDCAVQKKREQS